MIPSIQITGTSHEPESYTLLDASTTGAIALPDTSLVDLKNIVLPVDFTISTLDRYIGKRVLIEKPQDTTGIAINIIAPIPFSGSGIPFPLSTTYTLPDGALSLELVFGSTDYISVSNTGTVPVIPIPGTTTRELYVSINGSDTNTGNALYPFQTIQKAIDTVTGFGDATVTTQYKILVAGGQYNENLTLVPFINILSLSGDETSVSLNGSLDPSGLDIPQATFTISNFKFMQNPNWNTSGFGNALYIRFIECEFASGSNMDITQNNISIIAFIGCTIECDNCFWHTGGWIFSNTKGLLGTVYIEFDDTAGSIEVYFMNTTFIKADVHLKCSAGIGAIYHIADSYFEQSLMIDNDTASMTVYYDKLPRQNNFDGLTSVVFSRISDCFGESYTPTNPGNWTIVPNNVKYALDTVANAILYKYTPQSPPNWSSSFSGTVPATLYAALNILANNMFERYSNRFRIQTTIAAFGFNDVNSNILQTTNVAQASLSASGNFSISGSDVSISSTFATISLVANSGIVLSAVGSTLVMSGRNNVLLYPTGTVGQKTTQIGSSTAKQGIRYIVNDNSGTFGVTSGTVDLFSLTLLEPAISRSAYTGVVKICISDGLAPTVVATYYRPFVISGDGVSTYTINSFGAAIYQYATFGWPFGFPTFVMVVSGGSLSLNFNTGGAITPKINTYIEIERLN